MIKNSRVNLRGCCLIMYPAYIALVTLPVRKQRVQAYTRRGEPSTSALTLLTLGFQVRFERLCECETLMPNERLLLQKSHFAIHETPPSFLICPQVLKDANVILTERIIKCKHYFDTGVVNRFDFVYLCGNELSNWAVPVSARRLLF